ncbi:MAG: PorT family protein [Hymenobacter sp.]|nr:MAG: PorT family protein [Hymenobacter sp.]
MHLRITSFLTGGLLLVATVAPAQTRFSIGPTGGVQTATVHYPENQNFPSTYRPGLQAGLLATLTFGHFALQPAVLYSQKGYHSEGRVTYPDPDPFSLEAQADYRLNYVTIPLHFLYTQRATGQGWHVLAGPYLGLLLGGHYKAQSRYLNSTHIYRAEGKVVAGDLEPTASSSAYSRRVDAGLQAGIGYRYKAALVQLTYSWGLRNVASDFTFGGTAYARPAYYNRAVQVSLAYLFISKS